MSDHDRSPGRRNGLLLASAAVVAGLVLVVIVIRAQVSEPAPHDAGSLHPSTTPTSSSTSHGATSSRKTTITKGPTPLGPSKPVSLRIPAIGVDTPVLPIGLASDGTLDVPQPGPDLNKAAWFENSPTPGQPGASIIEGHVDSIEGPSVFLKLGDVKPGDKIYVRRQDGKNLTFQVYAVRDFLKTKFPTTLVYGSQQAYVPTLRLITCSNFDPAIEHHIGNEVVFARMLHAQIPTS